MMDTKELQTQKKQKELLEDLSLKLQSLFASKDFYSEALEVIRKHLDFYSIQLFEKVDDRSFLLKAQSGAYSSHLMIGHQMSMNQGIIGYVLRSKTHYVSNDTSKDKYFTSLSIPVKTKSQIALPILLDGEAIAALSVESDYENAFSKELVDLCLSIGNHLGILLHNVKLFEKIQTQNQLLQKDIEQKSTDLKSAEEKIQNLLPENEPSSRPNPKTGTPSQPTSIIGKSQALQQLLNMIDRVAPTEATILILGESGTGKELAAKRIHEKSTRSSMPFVSINCGALSETLLESELFGYEKGAFTGALSQKVGLVETAHGGTLFLDEIGELSPSIQSKFLRFLQEGEFYRVGGKKALKVDVRIVSATNRNLENEVEEGRFREDLFFRLNTISLDMPPLRERKEDLPLLMAHFLKKHPTLRFTEEAQKILQEYTWPGNIRELQNVMERVSILSDQNLVKSSDLPTALRNFDPSLAKNTGFSPHTKLQEVEKSHILQCLRFFEGNKTKTAKALGITVKTLYNKLERYGEKQHPELPEPLTRADGMSKVPERSASDHG